MVKTDKQNIMFIKKIVLLQIYNKNGKNFKYFFLFIVTTEKQKYFLKKDYWFLIKIYCNANTYVIIAASYVKLLLHHKFVCLGSRYLNIHLPELLQIVFIQWFSMVSIDK